MYMYEFDTYKKEVVVDCKLYPTDILKSESPWLYAHNEKYEDVDPQKVGKCMLFISKSSINAVWDKIKLAVANGELWHSKVSTTEPDKCTIRYAIMIYTKDYTDLNDVIHVLNYLESSGLKPPQGPIFYKTDEQTYAGIYRGGKRRPWIYSSATIRQEAITAT